jgi:4TM region of DNA translocase FtsK/SpoIIIE
MARMVCYGIAGFLLGGLGGIVGVMALETALSSTYTTQLGLGALAIPFFIAIIGMVFAVKIVKRKNPISTATSKPSKYGVGAFIAGIVLLIFGFSLSIIPIALLICGLYAITMSLKKERSDKRQMTMMALGAVLLIIVVVGGAVSGSNIGIVPHLLDMGA